MQELMLLSFSFSQSLGSRIRIRYRGDPNAGNFSGRGEHRALGRIYIYEKKSVMVILLPMMFVETSCS